MRKILHEINLHLEEWITVAFTIIFSVLAIVQVIVRYTPLTLQWTEEAARFAFIISVFIAVPWVTKSLSHLQVDILPLQLRKRVSERAFMIHRIVMTVLMALVSILIVYFSIIVCIKQFKLGQQLNGLPIPMWLMYSVLPVGFGLNFVRCLQNIVNDACMLRKGEN